MNKIEFYIVLTLPYSVHLFDKSQSCTMNFYLNCTTRKNLMTLETNVFFQYVIELTK